MLIPPWMLSAFIASLCFSSMTLLFRKLADLGTNTESINIFFFALATVALWSTAQLRHISLSVPSGGWRWLILAAILAVGANHFSITALRSAPNPGYVTALRSIDIAMVTIGSALLLGVSIHPLKLLGIGLCIAGVWVMGLSN